MGVVPEGEFEDFIRVLKEDLPTTFRVSPISPFNDMAQARLREFAADWTASPEEIEGVPLEAPTPLSWYPNDGAWYINASRGPIRSHPKYKAFHQFLNAFTEFVSSLHFKGESLILGELSARI